jgi:hypothetical protein
MSQITTSPNLLRAIAPPQNGDGQVRAIAIALLSMWNLDFFRSLYTPFCIHPEMSTLHVLVLDYLIGIYPLLLIALTYFAVVLHDQYPIIVKLWSPAFKLLAYIRREWNIRGSLIQAFATFLILSYTKILNVSFDLLTPLHLFNPKGKMLDNAFLFSNGKAVYFGKEHLPFGIIAIVMLTTFNIFPVLFLLLYPFQCFRKCLNRCRIKSHILLTFTDAFQGCYRNKPRDYRCYAPFYLFMRIFNLLLFAVLRDVVVLPVTGLWLMLLATTIIISQPHKVKLHNTVEAVLLLFYSCAYFFASTAIYFELAESKIKSRYQQTMFAITGIVILLTITIIGGVLLIQTVAPKKISQALKKIIKNLIETQAVIKNPYHIASNMKMNILPC